MSVAIPSTAQLKDDIVAQLQGAIGQTIPILPKAFVRVLAVILAGMFAILFRYCGFIFLQLFVAHATMSETTINGKKIRPLVELGRLFGVGDPLDATRAEMSVSLNVLTQTGTLPAGQRLVRSETGILYDVVAAVPLNAATVTLHIRASGDPGGTGGVGDIGNLQPGDKLALANPPATVDTEATVVAQLVTAADAEGVDHYRGRIFDKVQKRPQGGAYADYEEWGLEVPGIVSIFPYAGEDEGGSGPGQVDIYVEADPDSSGDPDGFPTAPQLAAVLANINLNNTSGKATRRPVNAAPNVRSITRVVFDAEIAGLQPDTPDTRTKILAGLKEHMLSRRPYIVGLSSLPRDDRVTQAAVSGIVDTIASAQGATVTGVTLLLSAVAITAYTLDHGQKAKFNTASYA